MANRLTAKEQAEWDEYYRQIKPLVTNLPPVLAPVTALSYEQCRADGERLYKQLKFLHDLPKVDGKAATEYLHETFELIRQRFIALHWRQIQIQAALAAHTPKENHGHQHNVGNV